MNFPIERCGFAGDLVANAGRTERACFAEWMLDQVRTDKEYPHCLAHLPPLVAQLIVLDDPHKGLSRRQRLWRGPRRPDSDPRELIWSIAWAEWALGMLTPVEVMPKVLEILVRPEVWKTGAGPYDPITGEFGGDYRELVLYENPHLTTWCVRSRVDESRAFLRLDGRRLQNPESPDAAAFVPQDGSVPRSRLPDPQ